MKKAILLFLLSLNLFAADPYYQYSAEVLEVHDGDTITARLDLGFDVSIVKNLRLLDVYAPELKEEKGQICRDKLHSLIPVGIKIDVMSIKTKTGSDLKSFDRYIAVVKYKGRDINKEMVDWLKKNNYTGGIGK